MPTATLTSNGRITLPPALRAALWLATGQKIEFLPEVMAPVLLRCGSRRW